MVFIKGKQLFCQLLGGLIVLGSLFGFPVMAQGAEEMCSLECQDEGVQAIPAVEPEPLVAPSVMPVNRLPQVGGIPTAPSAPAAKGSQNAGPRDREKRRAREDKSRPPKFNPRA